ncbi:MAG: c-type cytochrome biogenesis protein CcmI [Methylomarinum sp.]|nr:c-type cytochrome biogenesis protein CcmI [Methylomarinum sp.]
MNILYWLIVFVLLVIAFAIIIPPLWKNRAIEAADSDQRNIKIAQDRANDLKRQLESGALTHAQYDEQYAELELTLGDDLDIEQNTVNNSSQGRWAVPVVLILLPLCSLLIYSLIGEPDALRKEQLQQAQRAEKPPINVNAMVAGLAARLEKEPNNAEGWVMLGRSYKYLKKYPLAVDAFDKAYALLGENPEVMLHYADALAMANQGKLAGKATELIFKALEKQPNNETGLWLAGMAKAEIGSFAQAMQYWRKLETLLAPGSDSYRELQRLISAVQGQTTEVSKAVSINVQVSMDNSLKSISPADTVFIYAKALTGPPMPLAIVRKQVADLPMMVTLNDAMAMMPAMKLSNFKQVKVMARISKSGNAMQQKGDFIGAVELELAKNNNVVIVIDKEI